VKKIELVTKVDGKTGKIVSPSAEGLRDALLGHFGGQFVKITIQGEPKDIQGWRRQLYLTQYLPATVQALRDMGNADKDPFNQDDLLDANNFWGLEILGGHEIKNALGQKILLPKNPLRLSDRDFAGFLEKVKKKMGDLFGINGDTWTKEEANWQ